MLGPRLHKYYRLLFTGNADADKGGAVYPEMLVEDGFAGNREERAAGCDDAVGFAAAEPEAVIVVLTLRVG